MISPILPLYLGVKQSMQGFLGETISGTARSASGSDQAKDWVLQKPPEKRLFLILERHFKPLNHPSGTIEIKRWNRDYFPGCSITHFSGLIWAVGPEIGLIRQELIAAFSSRPTNLWMQGRRFGSRQKLRLLSERSSYYLFSTATIQWIRMMPSKQCRS